MTTLFVTPFTPRTGSGRGLRTVGIARALARFDDVDIQYLVFDGAHPTDTLEADPRVTLTALQASRGPGRAIAYTRARLAGVPRALARGVSAELVATRRNAASYDRIVADGPTAAAALILVGGLDNVIYNAHNIESGFRSTLSSIKRDYGSPEKIRSFEQKIMSRAAETWLPTRKDVRDAESIAPGAALRYMPNVVDVAAIEPVPAARTTRILFLADFTYEPNTNAARFLVDEVMPRLWSLVPHAELALVGRNLVLHETPDPRVHVLGFVPDIDAEYARAACVVVPLLQGGGSPLKMVEAMAYGMQIVATPVAAAGLEEASAGVHFLEADDADALAETLAAVCTSTSDGTRKAARELAESAYSIEALAALLP